MMRLMKPNILFTFLLGIIVFSSCEKWDEHNAVIDPVLTENLLQQINKNPDLSRFSEYLTKTGYDKVLASSKAFTVWAPTNEALQAIDEAVLNDTSRLKMLIGNHISNQSYFTSAVDSSIRIRALDGKNIIFTQTTYDEANITEADRYAGNGVLHVVDKAIIPKMSIWEYLNSSGAGNLQKEELQSLSYEVRNPATSVVTAYDENGDPIYQEGVGIDQINTYLQKNDISNEDSLYTYFILTDNAYTAEKDKLSSYFHTDTAEVSDSLTNYSVIKDLAVKGRYTPDNLPATLYSAKDSVVYTIDKSAIVSSYAASNGMVYVMSSLNYDMVSKLKPVIIEGETGYTLMSSKDVQLRTRRSSTDPENPLYNSFFKDLLIQNHGVKSFWVKYAPVLKAVTYKVYVRAVRDFDLVPPVGEADIEDFPMKIAFNSNTATDMLDFKNVGAIKNPDGTFSPNYDEVYIGDYTISNYGATDVFLIGNDVTTNGLNTILLDYIRLVPVPQP